MGSFTGSASQAKDSTAASPGSLSSSRYTRFLSSRFARMLFISTGPALSSRVKPLSLPLAEYSIKQFFTWAKVMRSHVPCSPSLSFSSCSAITAPSKAGASNSSAPLSTQAHCLASRIPNATFAWALLCTLSDWLRLVVGSTETAGMDRAALLWASLTIPHASSNGPLMKRFSCIVKKGIS